MALSPSDARWGVNCKRPNIYLLSDLSVYDEIRLLYAAGLYECRRVFEHRGLKGDKQRRTRPSRYESLYNASYVSMNAHPPRLVYESV